MVRKTDRCLVKDLNMSSSEEGVPQYRIVISRLVIPLKPYNKIVKLVSKSRVWKLKNEETARLFTHEIAARNDDVTEADTSRRSGY